MKPVVVVTGAASGIGAATVDYLRARGATVISADLREADVIADLATLDGRATFIDQVARRSKGVVDAVVANAGGGPVETSVQLNYFGTVATLEGLRPLLCKSDSPRAVAVSSIGSLFATRSDLMRACLSGNEEKAKSIAQIVARESAAAGADGHRVREMVYGNAKQALNQWCSKSAASSRWAGAGILLNVVALGVYSTPAAAFILSDPERAHAIQALTPLRDAFPGRPRDAAALLCWLISRENTQLTGQVLFADGGFEVSQRSALRGLMQ